MDITGQALTIGSLWRREIHGFSAGGILFAILTAGYLWLSVSWRSKVFGYSGEVSVSASQTHLLLQSVDEDALHQVVPTSAIKGFDVTARNSSVFELECDAGELSFRLEFTGEQFAAFEKIKRILERVD